MSEYKLRFGATDAGFTSSMKKVKGSLDGLDSNVKKTAQSVKTGFMAMAKAGAAFAVGLGAVKAAAAGVGKTIASFGDALDMGGTLNDLSARTGVAVSDLIVLRRAFENSGMSADKVGSTINKLQKSIVEAAGGSKTLVPVFNDLKLNIDELLKKSPAEQFQEVGKAINNIQSPTERAAIAMKILGKSGGEALALFRDGRDGIDEASKQLGSLPEIMARSAAIFDKVGDNLSAIKAKSVEFAAGFLEKVIPALDLATTMLSRFDAAALGMKLGEVLTGSSKAMDGFTKTLAAFSMGDFRIGMETLWLSIKLQAADSINSIYKNAKAALSGIAEFMVTTLGPGSGIWSILQNSFSILGDTLGLSMGNAIFSIIKDLNMVPDSVKQGMAIALKQIENDIQNSKNAISNSVSQIPGDMETGARRASDAFDEAFKNTKNIFDTTKLELELQRKKLEIMRKQSEEATKQAGKDLKDALTFGSFGKSGINSPTEKEEKASKNIAQNYKDAAVATKSYADNIWSAIKAAKDQDKTDPGGRIKKRVDEALAKGQFGVADRIGNRLDTREANRRIQETFNPGKAFGKSLAQIAKEQGVDTKGKSSRELRKELSDLAKKRQDEMDAKKRGMTKEEAAEKGKPQKDPMSAIEKAVQAIQKAVEKIEPKLPTAALGV